MYCFSNYSITFAMFIPGNLWITPSYRVSFFRYRQAFFGLSFLNSSKNRYVAKVINILAETIE